MRQSPGNLNSPATGPRQCKERNNWFCLLFQCHWVAWHLHYKPHSPGKAGQLTQAQATERPVYQKTICHQFIKFNVLLKKKYFAYLIYKRKVTCLQWNSFSSFGEFLRFSLTRFYFVFVATFKEVFKCFQNVFKIKKSSHCCNQASYRETPHFETNSGVLY